MTTKERCDSCLVSMLFGVVLILMLLGAYAGPCYLAGEYITNDIAATLTIAAASGLALVAISAAYYRIKYFALLYYGLMKQRCEIIGCEPWWTRLHNWANRPKESYYKLAPKGRCELWLCIFTAFVVLAAILSLLHSLGVSA